MKKMIFIAMAATTLSFASSCHPGFMKDKCHHDRYSVVETEAAPKKGHNCMAAAHFFPGEEPAGYCGHRHGKNVSKPLSPVVKVK